MLPARPTDQSAAWTSLALHELSENSCSGVCDMGRQISGDIYYIIFKITNTERPKINQKWNPFIKI